MRVTVEMSLYPLQGSPIEKILAFIETLRADPELRSIPIIVISAKELTPDESRTLRESVAFVMKKQGFDGDLLKEEINSVVKRYDHANH